MSSAERKFSGDFAHPTAFVLRLSYGEGVGEEVAMFTALDKFRWWIELYRPRQNEPKQIHLTVRYSSGRHRLHRFAGMRELKSWVKSQI